MLSAALSASCTTLLRVSRLSTWASELSRKQRRIGTRASGPTLFKAASRRRRPRSADCICANTLRRTFASRISVGFQTWHRSLIALDTGASLAVLPSPGSDGRARLRPRRLHRAHLARASGWATSFSLPARVSIPPASPAELPSQTAAECSSVAFARRDQLRLL